MFSNIATKVALKKLGLPSNTLDFDFSSSSTTDTPRRQPNKLRKAPPAPKSPDDDDDDDDDGGWPSWMSVKSLPLTVHPWLAPPPPPVDVAIAPRIGDAAPTGRDGKLEVGGGRRVLIVFLRCVGCAFAQKTFLSLRTMANRYANSIHCVAVSHSSPEATKKWIDLLGGAWNVEVIIDEDRSLYAAWGLGLGGMWYLFNPTTQAHGWKEKGWLGNKVAGAIQRNGGGGADRAEDKITPARGEHGHDDVVDSDVSTALGNKWQEAGAFAVDGQGTVIWGGKALRADDVMDLEEGAKLLML